MPHSSACTSNGHRLKPTSPQVVSASAPDCTCAFMNGLTILHSISRTEPASSSLLLDVLLLHIEETGQYFTTGCQTPGSVGGIADESKIDPSDDRVFCPPKRFAGIGSQKDVPSERTAPSHCALLEWLTFAARMLLLSI